MKRDAIPPPTNDNEAPRLLNPVSRFRKRRTLSERLARAAPFSQVAVSLPGLGRVATARWERGKVACYLYERHRVKFGEIADAFRVVYPSDELRPPVDADWLRQQRAAWLRRYGRRRG